MQLTNTVPVSSYRVTTCPLFRYSSSFKTISQVFLPLCRFLQVSPQELPAVVCVCLCEIILHFLNHCSKEQGPCLLFHGCPSHVLRMLQWKHGACKHMSSVSSSWQKVFVALGPNRLETHSAETCFTICLSNYWNTAISKIHHPGVVANLTTHAFFFTLSF